MRAVKIIVLYFREPKKENKLDDLPYETGKVLMLLMQTS